MNDHELICDPSLQIHAVHTNHITRSPKWRSILDPPPAFRLLRRDHLRQVARRPVGNRLPSPAFVAQRQNVEELAQSLESDRFEGNFPTQKREKRLAQLVLGRAVFEGEENRHDLSFQLGERGLVVVVVVVVVRSLAILVMRLHGARSLEPVQ